MVAITSFQSMFQTTSTAKTATTAATSSTSASASSSTAVAPTQRASDASGAVKLEFTAGQPRTADTVRDQLRGKIDQALGSIYKDKDQLQGQGPAGEGDGRVAQDPGAAN